MPTATPGNTPAPTTEPVSCSGFASQFGAQQFYDFNASPQQRAMLDADGDGFACEEGDQGTATAQPATPVAQAPVATTALPDTGGPALLLPLGAGLLLAGGLGVSLLRRR